MAVPASPNAASFSDIQTAFGGSNPISLNEYYAGGGLTRTGTGVHTPNGIPTSGAISVDDFRGGNNFFESWSTSISEADAFLFTTSRGYAQASSYFGSPVPQQGSMSDNTPDQGAMNGSYTITASVASTASAGKGQPVITQYSVTLSGPNGLSNDDLSAFKTLTINGRGTFPRSDATFSKATDTQYNWLWSNQPASVFTATGSTRTYSMTNA